MTDPDDRTSAPPSEPPFPSAPPSEPPSPSGAAPGVSSETTTEAMCDPGPDVASVPDVDLAAFERDLDAVEAALARLDDGTYRTDEITGEPIPDHVLADDPTARRA